jgi:nucleotide-binding universal stress UspA family protein
MNIIFATDFYTSSTTARALLTRLAWPAEARLELLHVLTAERRASLFAARLGPRQDALDAAARELRAFATDLEKHVEESLGHVHHTIRVGDPAGVILEHATASDADLVVIGGPGRAESASGVMSSVSAAVIDRAPCSVLVARSGSVDKLVLNDDGTVAGEIAARVSRWPLFRSIRVTSVAVGTARDRVPLVARDLVVFGADSDSHANNAGELHRAFAGTGASVLIARNPPEPLPDERLPLDQAWVLGRG